VWKYCQRLRHSDHSNQWGCKCRKIPQNSPFPGARGPPLIHQCHCLGPPTHHTKRQVDCCTHFRTTTQQRPHWLQWDAPYSPPKLPLITLRRSPPPSNRPILRPTPLTTPNGIQIQSTIRHNMLCRPTDRQIDGPGESSVPWALSLAMLIESDALTTWAVSADLTSTKRILQKKIAQRP